MIKSYLLITFLCLAAFTLNAQNMKLGGNQGNKQDEGEIIDFGKEQTLKEQVDETCLDVANRLMSCCSKFGGNYLKAEVNYSECRYNSTTEVFTIPMTAHWYGSLTGIHYWIKGKLLIAPDGSKKWIKISDSGGFSPGCSKNCIQ